MSNPVTEEELIARSLYPRVTLEEMQANIKDVLYIHTEGSLLTICKITLQNGFEVIGTSACAVPGNYKKDVGERLARKDAEGQIWPLMGYELKTKVAMVQGASLPHHMSNLGGDSYDTYVGNKVIHAKPMNRRDYNTKQGWTMPPHENGDDEGYLVEYADGHHLTWSPKDVFERAYTPINIFGEGSQIPTEEVSEAKVPPSVSEAAGEANATWEQRLAKEADELRERRDKLAIFIGGELFNNLIKLQQDLLVEQLGHMNNYLSVLEAHQVG